MMRASSPYRAARHLFSRTNHGRDDRQLAAGVELAREVLDEHLHERRDRGELGQGRHPVACPHLDRAPARSRADVPPHLGRVGHHTGADHVLEVPLELGPVLQRPGEPRRRKLLEHERPIRRVAGALARPERGRRRQRLKVRKIDRQRVDDREHLVDVLDADVHVDAPDHHVAAPPLGPLDEVVVPRLVGDLLVVPLRERVAPGAQQLDAEGVRDRAGSPRSRRRCRRPPPRPCRRRRS